MTPPEGAKLGERVTFAGFDGKAAEPSRMGACSHPAPPRPATPRPAPPRSLARSSPLHPSPPSRSAPLRPAPPRSAPPRADKKKLFDEAAKELRVAEGGVAAWRGVPFMTSAGPCRVATAAPGSVIR